MKELRYTLLTDGSSDVALMPILTWLLIEHGLRYAIQPQWADLRQVRLFKKLRLADKMALSLEWFPCELLFVHRDAEREPRAKRVSEIRQAVEKAAERCSVPPAVCVVPVRMQEAWLLFDEQAIRYAAGNRSGRQPLDLPPRAYLEDVLDPKAELHRRLRLASGLSGRRLKNFPVYQRACRVAECSSDFSPLRVLSAFRALENDIDYIIEQRCWH